MSKYPDIYHGDNITSWDKIENTCPFIIFKATEGQTYVDSKLSKYIEECEERNIPYWVYAFLKKGSELAQTKFMVKTCKDIVGDNFVGYVLDAEQENTASNIQSCMDYLQTVGTKYMLYCMYADYSKYKSIILNRPTRCAYWEARYGKNTGTYSSSYPPHDEADLHQFTENGTCSGISNKCDLNRITGNGKKETWFKTPRGATKAYTGTFPALPPRGYYQIGDGYETLTDYPTQIKRVQRVVNWAIDGDLTVDGKYGEKTAEAVKKVQKLANTTQNGKFGDKCLAYVKALKK